VTAWEIFCWAAGGYGLVGTIVGFCLQRRMRPRRLAGGRLLLACYAWPLVLAALAACEIEYRRLTRRIK
jgi:hypothetical protein